MSVLYDNIYSVAELKWLNGVVMWHAQSKVRIPPILVDICFQVCKSKIFSCHQEVSSAAPELNLRNPLHAGASEGSTLALKSTADVIKCPKQEY